MALVLVVIHTANKKQNEAGKMQPSKKAESESSKLKYKSHYFSRHFETDELISRFQFKILK